MANTAEEINQIWFKDQMKYVVQCEKGIVHSISSSETDEALLACMDAELEPEAFINIAAQAYYEAALSLYNKGSRNIGTVEVLKQLADKPDSSSISVLESIGGQLAIIDLIEFEGVAYAPKYIPIIKEAWMLRKAVQISHELMQVARFPEDRTADEIIASGISKLKSLESGGLVQASSVTDGLKQVVKSLEQSINSERGSMFGMSTGIKNLDEKTGGLQKGHLVGIAGGPKGGKSALALKFVETVVLEENKGALVFSMEMDTALCSKRLVCQRSMIDFKRIADGIGKSTDREAFKKGLAEFTGKPLWVHDDSRVTIRKISSRLRAHLAKHPETELVVVDYIGLVKPVNRGEFRDDVNAEITRELKDMAKEFNICVVILAQIGVGDRKGANKYKKPQGSDIKFGSSLEADCDKLLMVWRKEDGERSIVIDYQRDGESGVVDVDFTGWCVAFDDKDCFQERYNAYHGKGSQENMALDEEPRF